MSAATPTRTIPKPWCCTPGLPDPATNAVAVPIYQTTSYQFDTPNTRPTCSR